MTPAKIPLFRPVIHEQAIEAVAAVLRSGWLGLGPQTHAFEEAFAKYVGISHCVGLNSCTSALHLGLRLLNLPAGSEVITTPLTFVATNHVILHVGCRPVFADIQPQTGNLDVASVVARINERTKAIMLVHYGGYPCDLDEFYAVARERNVAIIEDCAHACGARYRGKRIGSHGDLHAFSFQATKNLPMGDGGVLTVRSADYDARLRKLRSLGVDRDAFLRSEHGTYDWQYDVTEIGFKCAMNDLHAAIGLVQLRYLEENNAIRARLTAQYRERLAKVPGVQLLQHQEDRTSSFHLFCVLVEKRDALVDKLQAGGVDVGVHYRRNDCYPMYEAQELPNAERFSQCELSLPMHTQLTDEQVEYVTDIIRRGW